jgi:hypothetical protein
MASGPGFLPPHHQPSSFPTAHMGGSHWAGHPPGPPPRSNPYGQPRFGNGPYGTPTGGLHHPQGVWPQPPPDTPSGSPHAPSGPYGGGRPPQPPSHPGSGGFFNAGGPTGAQASWNPPQRLVGPDPSTGKKGELWAAKAGEDMTMLQAFSAPGMTLEAQVRAADQSLDAVGLPGTSTQGSDDFQLARLSDAVLMMARGTMNTTNTLL